MERAYSQVKKFNTHAGTLDSNIQEEGLFAGDILVEFYGIDNLTMGLRTWHHAHS